MNDVRAIEARTRPSSDRTLASGRLVLTAQTARLTSFVKPAEPVRGLRTAYTIVRRTKSSSPSNLSIIIGHMTVVTTG